MSYYYLINWMEWIPPIGSKENIMEFANHIKNVIMTFPGTFSDALRVYNHIFLEIGIGYNWKDGKLVYSANEEFCDNKEDAIKRILLDLCENQKLLDSCKKVNPIIIEHRREQNISNAAKAIDTVNNVDNIVNDLSIKDYGDDRVEFCVSEFSAIANIPDNVNTDCLNEITKFVQILKDNMDRVDDPDNLLNGVIARVEGLNSK